MRELAKRILLFKVVIFFALIANTEDSQYSSVENENCTELNLSEEQCSALLYYVGSNDTLYKASNSAPQPIAPGYRTDSLQSGTSSNQTAYFGWEAGGTGGLTCDSSCPYHTAIGNYAMHNVTGGSYSTALGQGAMRYGTASPESITALGSEAFAYATGRDVVAVGRSAHERGSGSYSVAIGNYACMTHQGYPECCSWVLRRSAHW